MSKHQPAYLRLSRATVRTIITTDFEYARLLIDMYEHETPILQDDGKRYSIVAYAVESNDEIINYGGFWGGEPGLYRVRNPPTYQFELTLYRGE